MTDIGKMILAVMLVGFALILGTSSFDTSPNIASSPYSYNQISHAMLATKHIRAIELITESSDKTIFRYHMINVRYLGSGESQDERDAIIKELQISDLSYPAVSKDLVPAK